MIRPGVGRTPTVEKVTATGGAVQDAGTKVFDQDGRRHPLAGAGTLKQARVSKPRRTRESHRCVTYPRYMVFKVLGPRSCYPRGRAPGGPRSRRCSPWRLASDETGVSFASRPNVAGDSSSTFFEGRRCHKCHRSPRRRAFSETGISFATSRGHAR